MEESINLLVRNPYLAEYEFRLQVRRSLTVALLKQELAQSYEGQPSTESQRLIYAGRLLQDQELLGELLVVETEDNEHVIFLSIKRTGGESSTSPAARVPFHSSPSTVTQTVFTSSSFTFTTPMSSHDTPISFASPPRYTFSTTEESPQNPLPVPSDSSLLSGLTSSCSESDMSSPTPTASALTTTTTLGTAIATTNTSPIPAAASSPMAAAPSPMAAAHKAAPVDPTAATTSSFSFSSPSAESLLPPLPSNYNEAMEAYLSQAYAYYNWMAQMYAYQYHMYCASHAPVAETPVLYGHLFVCE